MPDDLPDEEDVRDEVVLEDVCGFVFEDRLPPELDLEALFERERPVEELFWAMLNLPLRLSAPININHFRLN